MPMDHIIVTAEQMRAIEADMFAGASRCRR